MSALTRLGSGYRGGRIPKSGLGMVLEGGGYGRRRGRGGPIATSPVTYVTPGQPHMPDWDADWASRGLYLQSGYVMRCCRLRADTVAGLPYRAGPDPTRPGDTNSAAPLAKLLGPATVLSPGGPNATTSSRAFWAWSIVQKIVTGRQAWETIGPDPSVVEELWPLVSRCVQPIHSDGGKTMSASLSARAKAGLALSPWFDKFVYSTPLGDRDIALDQIFYAWRPSILDWREPESDLQASRVAVQLIVGIERYMWSLMTNGMVARQIVVTPGFEESEARRAWEESFLSEFTGFDNAGKTIFAEVENEFDETTGKMVDKAEVQVLPLATKGIDAQMREVSQDAKRDVNIFLGVPLSLLGDASQRTYANADSEWRNFWTITVINDITEQQDAVNVSLAPRIGKDVGWFDLSQVTAVQPPQLFQPPAIKDAIDLGIVTPEQVAALLNIPRLTAGGEDTTTAPVGEELAMGMSMMTRSLEARSLRLGRRAAPSLEPREGWVDAPEGWRFLWRPTTTYTLTLGTAGWGLERIPRERIEAGLRESRTANRDAPLPEAALSLHTSVARIRRRRELGLRAVTGKLGAAGLAVKAADTGRVLMIQRSDRDPTDPAGGTWEFPGGHIDAGEDSLDAAMREWSEEMGCPLPPGDVAGSWTSPNGVYRGHVLVVPSEDAVLCNLDPSRRKVLNPDDPDQDDIEVAAWWHPRHVVADNPAVRREVRKSIDTWAPVVKSARPARRSAEIARGGSGRTGQPSNPATGGATDLSLVDLEALDLGSLDRLGDALALSMSGGK